MNEPLKLAWHTLGEALRMLPAFGLLVTVIVTLSSPFAKSFVEDIVHAKMLVSQIEFDILKSRVTATEADAQGVKAKVEEVRKDVEKSNSEIRKDVEVLKTTTQDIKDGQTEQRQDIKSILRALGGNP